MTLTVKIIDNSPDTISTELYECYSARIYQKGSTRKIFMYDETGLQIGDTLFVPPGRRAFIENRYGKTVETLSTLVKSIRIESSEPESMDS